jgi:hypothetical protein
MSGNKHMAYFRKVMSGGIEVASLLAQVDALPQPSTVPLVTVAVFAWWSFQPTLKRIT